MLSVFLHVLNWQQTRGLWSAFWQFKKKIGKKSFRKLKGYKSNLYNLFIQRNRERERKKERLVSSSKRYKINMYSCIYTTVLEVMQNIPESIILEFVMCLCFVVKLVTYLFCLFGFFTFYFSLKNFSLVWKIHYCRWRTSNFDLFDQRLVAIDQWDVLYCATPTVTRDIRL